MSPLTFLGTFLTHPLSAASSEMLPLAEEWRKRYCIAAVLELLMHNYQSELLGHFKNKLHFHPS